MSKIPQGRVTCDMDAIGTAYAIIADHTSGKWNPSENRPVDEVEDLLPVVFS
jgi:hypothetical protein